MILTLGEFIMENITWIDLTMAGITLLSVIVSIFILVKSDNSTRDILAKDEEKTRDNLLNAHKIRSWEHNNLTKEHHSLKERQIEIKNTVNFLEKAVLQEQAKRKDLSQQPMDIQNTLDKISLFADLLLKTQKENDALRKEIHELRAENERLKNSPMKSTPQRQRQHDERER